MPPHTHPFAPPPLELVCLCAPEGAGGAAATAPEPTAATATGVEGVRGAGLPFASITGRGSAGGGAPAGASAPLQDERGALATSKGGLAPLRCVLGMEWQLS